jgi:predicted DNA-binding ribbon-helix-helix protein
MQSLIIKRSVAFAGRKTSVSLENDFWNGLREIAVGRGETVSELIAAIDADRQHANLSSAIRLFVFGFYRDQCADYDSRTGEPALSSPTPADRHTLRR